MEGICDRTSAAGALLLLIVPAAPSGTPVAPICREARASVLAERFLSSLPRNFVLPAAGDGLGARLLAEYGAVLVAGDGVSIPSRSIFSSEEEVSDFQSSLRISGGKYKLQAAAAEALEAAGADAERHGRRISPATVDAAARSYRDTVKLWKRRLESALQYWLLQGRLNTAAATEIRSLSPREQARAIMRLEQEGMFFGAGFAKSILSSVAPPGTSQHLALLAFDVKEHRDATVRTILEHHGWYQTVLRDAPHFTYLGVSKTRLPSLGLMLVRDGDREYWIPGRPRFAGAAEFGQAAGYPPTASTPVNPPHWIVPVIAAPFTAVALIVNVPPAPDAVKVTFPEPATALSPGTFTVLATYDLPPATTLSENMSPDIFLGRH